MKRRYIDKTGHEFSLESYALKLSTLTFLSTNLKKLSTLKWFQIVMLRENEHDMHCIFKWPQYKSEGNSSRSTKSKKWFWFRDTLTKKQAKSQNK